MRQFQSPCQALVEGLDVPTHSGRFTK